MTKILEFQNVSFIYQDNSDKKILSNVSFTLEKGKVYALVGPTGGGKTTTASIMARLYQPNSGLVLFKGKNIDSYKSEDLYWDIGFILQEPFLFEGNVGENIIYGNKSFYKFDNESLKELLIKKGLFNLLDTFPEKLKTRVEQNSDTISLGQKQIVAFLRAILRDPELLILDEYTANLDTITENYLQKILDQLPKSVTKVVIAHRLSTIKSADVVFTIGGGKVKVVDSL
jgi:ATP-binding cassette, subfamily B, bacterial